MSQTAPDEAIVDESGRRRAPIDYAFFNDLRPGFALQPMDWEDEGSCRSVGPDKFFLEAGQNARQAKQICGGCPVRQQCLDHVMRTEGKHLRWGVWGGTTPEERRLLAAQDEALLSE